MNMMEAMTDIGEIRLIVGTPNYEEGTPYWNEDDLEQIVTLANRIDARATAAEATIEAIRTAMGGYRDSDLASLATTIQARNEHLEVEVADCRDALQDWQVAAGIRQAERDEARAEVARLRGILADIAAMTDADDPESYRSDDREGCLDTVYAKALRA